MRERRKRQSVKGGKKVATGERIRKGEIGLRSFWRVD